MNNERILKKQETGATEPMQYKVARSDLSRSVVGGWLEVAAD